MARRVGESVTRAATEDGRRRRQPREDLQQHVVGKGGRHVGDEPQLAIAGFFLSSLTTRERVWCDELKRPGGSWGRGTGMFDFYGRRQRDLGGACRDYGQFPMLPWSYN